MCGLVGIVGTSAVNQRIYDALTVLQHRGQDAAGIMTMDEHALFVHKDAGLVRDVFREEHMRQLVGNVGIGHVRYPTAGCDGADEAQPFYVNAPFGIGLGHNGNLTNADELSRTMVEEDRRHLNTRSDSEVLLNVFASELQRSTAVRAGAGRRVPRDRGRVPALPRRLRGRDDDRGPRRRGLPRPARHPAAGARQAQDGARASSGCSPPRASPSTCSASRWCATSGRARRSTSTCTAACTRSSARRPGRHTPCIFEYVYFARPDSIIDNISVHKARMRMGEKLAEKIRACGPTTTSTS